MSVERASRRALLVWIVAGVLGGLLAGSRDAEAGPELVVVLNEKNAESPTFAQTKRIYVGDDTFWHNNVPVRCIVRPADSPAGLAFHRAIQITPSRFKRLWQEKQLSGQGMAPDTIAPIHGLVARVAADPGAIGVATTDELPAHAPGVRFVVIR